MNQSYTVKLDSFEGPLDLLLHLINRYEIDIYDIPVKTITEQYMAYVRTMQELELNIASEYLVMAATLLAMKSGMLLPNQEIEVEDDEYEEEDPREQLMNQLLQYRKYKEAAQTLKERENDTHQIFTRPAQSLDEYRTKEEDGLTQGEVTVYDMIGAMKNMLKRKQWDQPLEARVERQEIPISERMEEVLTKVRGAKSGIHFTELFPVPTRSHVVVTFIAILELMKNRSIYCEQQHHFEDIVIYQLEE
ncbi:segregation and condensation protein A [Pontibacillus halophilus JSM 076056 = DSM 19796]|uniref:Segregation and condensation protein A n=1 Tax=Pontibacillus halophilus JSM 076056 = DSM 19796 TaxID=1385510 RepID=A0A0A5GLV1_9BACI|nr:segregation/condensation protein A [Pontibacillus halophilus]KGX92213.1 segregation and condensation protein A [Pontibacillus halophilus JSM 076056 = DSM 19796]